MSIQEISVQVQDSSIMVKALGVFSKIHIKQATDLMKDFTIMVVDALAVRHQGGQETDKQVIHS